MLSSIHQDQNMLISTSAAIACLSIPVSVSLGRRQAGVAGVVDGDFPLASALLRGLVMEQSFLQVTQAWVPTL